MKMSEGYCKGWDAKFKKDELYGKIGEDFVAQLIGTDEIKSEVKENRQEVMKLKQEMATGKGAIRTAIFIGSILGAIYTFFRLMD